jgi:two-component system, OmpR family, sensor kinase
VKLSSTARLRIAIIAITTILTVGIGTFAAVNNYQSERADIDSSIAETVQAANDNPTEELSAALFYLDQYSLDLSLFLLSRDGELTSIKESTHFTFDRITLRDAAQATRSVVSGVAASHYRMKSLEISGGDYLVVASSTNEADATFRQDLITVAIVATGTNLVAFLIISLYIRRIKRRDDLDALSRMQEFLGDASHELRTPLTVIKGYIEMLSKGMIESHEDRTRAFTRVTSEIGRMESLIHDLLLLAELGESAERESETINLSELLKAHGEDFATLHPSRDVSFAIESNIEITAVRDYLVRFIQNALTNIARHTDAKAPVKISLSAKGKVAQIIIEDGGKGLPDAAYLEKSRSLQRFDSSRSRENGGSGLGMSIMAAVINKVGGEFSLRKSELGGLAVVATVPRLNS